MLASVSTCPFAPGPVCMAVPASCCLLPGKALSSSPPLPSSDSVPGRPGRLAGNGTNSLLLVLSSFSSMLQGWGLGTFLLLSGGSLWVMGLEDLAWLTIKTAGILELSQRTVGMGFHGKNYSFPFLVLCSCSLFSAYTQEIKTWQRCLKREQIKPSVRVN